MWLLLLTGVRRNEILAAKWADVDWDNKTLYIGKTKNGEAVLTPLSRAAIARLKLIPKFNDNPFIICGAIPGKPLAYLDAMWRRIRLKTGFHDLRIHDLRRTVGSWLVRDGASLHLVGAVLNHKDQKTTAGYAYFQTEDRQKALDRHGRKIVQITKGGVQRRAKHNPPVDAPSEGNQKLPRVSEYQIGDSPRSVDDRTYRHRRAGFGRTSQLGGRLLVRVPHERPCRARATFTPAVI